MTSKSINVAALRQHATPSSGACMSRLARSPHLLACGGVEGALARIRRQGTESELLRPAPAQPWVQALVREAEAFVRCRLAAHQVTRLVTAEVGQLIAHGVPLAFEFDPAPRTLRIVRHGSKVSEIVIDAGKPARIW